MANLFKGAICFSLKPGNVISEAIAWVTESDFSHVFIGADSFHGQPLIFEASFGGAILTSWKHYQKEYNYEIWLPKATPEQIDTALESVYPLIGKKYGYDQLWKTLLVKAARTAHLNCQVKASDNFVCSTLGLQYLLAFPHLKPFFEAVNDPNFFTPKDIRDTMIRHGEHFYFQLARKVDG